MANGFNHKILVEFSTIFDEAPKDLKAYLTGINQSVLLNIVSLFLGFKNRGSKYDDYREFIKMFFCEENSDFSHEVNDKLNERKGEKLIIIEAYSTLQLFEYCFDHLKDLNTQSKAETERNIFKAILFQNETNISLQNLAYESTKSINSEIKLAALCLTQSFAYSELINYDKIEVLACQIIKSVYLFEFLESNSNTKILLAKFLKYFNCTNWQEYIKNLFPLAFSVLQAEGETYTDILVKHDDDFEKNCEFTERLVIDDTEIAEDYDFVKIRSRPFYKVQNGVFRVIFGLFVIELIHKGLFFKLSEINNTLDIHEKASKEFRGFYCDEFSEKYLLYKILNSIYQNKYIEFSGSEIKEHKIVAEPDYYIRNGNTVFLFESKDILINKKIKPTYDYAQYETEFKKKLYFEDNNGKIEKKAVLQLVNNIERLLQKQLSIDIRYNPNSIFIYPIIVLHDHQFNIAGLNVLVNSWFKEELNKLLTKGLNISKVQPITIMDIDTLIFHQDLFGMRILKLNEVLDEYFRFVTFDNKKKYRDKEHMEQSVQQTLLPFSSFFSNYVEKKKISRIPKMLHEKGITIFDELLK